MSNQTCLAPIPDDIAFITGPTMLGICFSWGFLGVILVQLYFYHISFPNDGLYMKVLVYGLATVDIVQTCLVTADAFHWFVFGFGNLDRLDDTFINSWDVVFLDAVIALIVQAFYCWRIAVLRKSYILPGIILLVSLTQCATGIAKAVIANRIGHLSKISTAGVPEQTTWLVGSAVADIMITVVLSWTLLRRRSQIPQASHSVIMRLVIMTVETNGITTLMAVIALILYLGVPQHSTLVVPPTAILGKLYINCLIAVLNNRRLSQQNTSRNYSGTGTGSSGAAFNRGFQGRATTTSTSGSDTLAIQMVRNVEFKRDSEPEIELNIVDKEQQESAPYHAV